MIPLPHLIAALLLTLPLPALAAGAHNPPADAKAAAELRLRAERGDGDAALQIGNMLVQKRIAAAAYGNPVDWYRKGCALRDVSACHNAGVSSQHGRNGAKTDYAEAAEYYLRAAERGFMQSMFNLAIMHAESQISSIDHREGLKWLLVAQRAAAQCPEAPICRLVQQDPKGYRGRLEARLSVAERRETQRLADAWQPVAPGK